MIVADDAFPLKEYIQKPYSHLVLTKETRIFNYRFSRARPTVENAFVILANRFRVFMTPIGLAHEKVETIVLACCSLHNYFISKLQSHATYATQVSLNMEDPETHTVSPGEWRQNPEPQGWMPLEQQGSNRHSNKAKELRNYLCDYFNSKEGAISWQDNLI